tara:strand:+ start:11905 stop:12225 length:321 start_codon:yes stop_codon:yes gene_type:complete
MNNQEKLFIVKESMLRGITPASSKLVTKTMQGIRKGDDSLARNIVSRFENNPQGNLGPMGLHNLDTIKAFAQGLPANTGRAPTQFNRTGYENLRNLIETLLNNKMI